MSAAASPAQSPATETPGNPSSEPAGTRPSLTASDENKTEFIGYEKQIAAFLFLTVIILNGDV